MKQPLKAHAAYRISNLKLSISYKSESVSFKHHSWFNFYILYLQQDIQSDRSDLCQASLQALGHCLYQEQIARYSSYRVYFFHRNCNTRQSFHVSVMSVMSLSVIKKSNNSEGQIVKYCKILSVRKQGFYTLVIAFCFINVFFLVKKNFSKRGNFGHQYAT